MNTQDILAQAWRLSPARMGEYLAKDTSTPYVRFPYIELIDEVVTNAVIKGGARIIISLPPRHGKSFFTSYHLPAWFLSRYPHKHVILASYEANFASHWGRQTRNLLTDRKELGVTISEDSSAADRWNTSEGGGMFCTGIGGPITGRGGQLLIVDDPVKNWEEARSETIRQNHIDWFNSTFYTRAEPGASIIILMTRWHENDLAGYLLADSKKWTEIRLPAFAEDDDILGRSVGDALCPQRFNVSDLMDIKSKLGPNMFASLYQQRPVPLEGDIFKKEMFHIFPIPAQMEWDYKFAMVDTAYSDKMTNDFTCAVIFGMKDKVLWVIDVFRQRIKAADVEVPLMSFLARYSDFGFRGVYIEPKGHGIYLNTLLQRKGVVMPSDTTLKEFFKDRKADKVIRANNAAPYLSNTKVVINESIHCKDELMSEVLGFPRGRHDDFVDCLVDGIKLGLGGLNSNFSTLDVLPALNQALTGRPF